MAKTPSNRMATFLVGGRAKKYRRAKQPLSILIVNFILDEALEEVMVVPTVVFLGPRDDGV